MLHQTSLSVPLSQQHLLTLCLYVSHFGNSYNISNFLFIIIFVIVICDFQVVLVVKNPPAKAGGVRTGSVPGLGRSLGGGHGNPLQNSCLENPMDRGAWQVKSIESQKVRHN